jgi:hypothetical protein
VSWFRDAQRRGYIGMDAGGESVAVTVRPMRHQWKSFGGFQALCTREGCGVERTEVAIKAGCLLKTRVH